MTSRTRQIGFWQRLQLDRGRANRVHLHGFEPPELNRNTKPIESNLSFFSWRKGNYPESNLKNCKSPKRKWFGVASIWNQGYRVNHRTEPPNVGYKLQSNFNGNNKNFKLLTWIFLFLFFQIV